MAQNRLWGDREGPEPMEALPLTHSDKRGAGAEGTEEKGQGRDPRAEAEGSGPG